MRAEYIRKKYVECLLFYPVVTKTGITWLVSEKFPNENSFVCVRLLWEWIEEAWRK